MKKLPLDKNFMLHKFTKQIIKLRKGNINPLKRVDLQRFFADQTRNIQTHCKPVIVISFDFASAG